MSEAIPADAAGAAVSVGAQLRKARIAANLTVGEVAHSLKFSPRQIERLEADDYAALPGSTIVRGFVRSYARLLKLDADRLLGDLDAAMPSVAVDVRPPDNMGIAAEPGGLRGMSPVLSALVALLLAAALLALWLFFGPSATRPPAAANRNEAPPKAAPVQPTPAETANATIVAPAAVPAAAPDVPPAVVESAAAPPVPAPVQNAAPGLHFTFAERSWVEVTDAKKQMLHSGENPAGSQLTLQGRPPFEIVIGNAGKVTLTYGERMIDLAPHTRAEVARLTVD